MLERDWQKDWELVCEAQVHNDPQNQFQRVLDVCIYWLLWAKDAMDRMQELEAEDVRLEQRVQGLENGLLYQAEVATRLEAENRRLRAVAEAAREFAEAFKQDAGFDDWFERCWDKQIKLERALAAPRGGKQ